MTDLCSTIEKLFARLQDSEDGEFGEWEDRRPYLVISPRFATGRLIFTTKAHVAPHAIVNQSEYSSLGTVCRYGLPNERDLAWIRPMASQHELYFLGDLDPLDLLVFAWLRAALAPQTVTHLGINDSYLSALAIRITPEYQIALAPSEQEALGLLPQLLPDLEGIVGPRAMQILNDGRKVELEAIVSALGGHERVLRPIEGRNAT